MPLVPDPYLHGQGQMALLADLLDAHELVDRLRGSYDGETVLV
jgi:hypothetical protein